MNLHHAGNDQLFSTVLLNLSQRRMLDLMPLVSGQPSSSSTALHLTYTLLSFLRQGLGSLLPHLLTKISEKGFTPTYLSKDDWIMRVLKAGKDNFSGEEYDALLSSMSHLLRAKLLRACCDSATNFAFLKRIVVGSYEEGSLPSVLCELLKLVGTLSAADYIDDCLVHTCPGMPAAQLLGLVRALSDRHVISAQQDKLWLMVGYARRGDVEMVQGVLQELYPNQNSVYFSGADLGNLVVLMEEMEEVKSELEKRLCTLNNIQSELSDIIKEKDTSRLMEFDDVSVALLNNNGNLYEIARRFGIHTAVFLLNQISTLHKDSLHLTEFLRQIEVAEDTKMFALFLTYYGFLLPRQIKLYGESVLRKHGILKECGYSRLTEAQLYLYSYCAYMPINQELLDSMEHLQPGEIANLLLVQCILYPGMGDKVGHFLKSGPYRKKLSSAKHLLKFMNLSGPMPGSKLRFVKKVVVADQLRLFDSR